MADQRSSKELPPLPPMLKEHNPPAQGDRAQLYTSDQMYAYGRECTEWGRSRSMKAAQPTAAQPSEAATPRATLQHDAGAYAQCHYCRRYSLDPRTLSDRQPVCECGKQHGWCGSFKPPGPDAKWSGATPPQQEPAAPKPAEYTMADWHRDLENPHGNR